MTCTSVQSLPQMVVTVDASYTPPSDGNSKGVAGLAGVVWSGEKPLFVVAERTRASSITQAEAMAISLAVRLAQDNTEVVVCSDNKNVADNFLAMKSSRLKAWLKAHNVRLKVVWSPRTNNAVADAFAALAYRRGAFQMML